jgi:hypothetical protein
MMKTAIAALALLVGILASGVLKISTSLAFFSASHAAGANAFSTASLTAPTGLAASSACEAGPTARANLSWTASPDAFAGGYDVYRAASGGGPYSKIAHVAGGGATGYQDPGLQTATTYFYVVQATASGWTSPDSNQAQTTTPGSCP